MNTMRRIHPGLSRAARRQGGFSLIEIVVVIVLIGGVVAFAANQIGDNAQRSNWNLAKAQVQALAAKVETYELDNGSPPARLEDLVKDPGNAPGWNGPYARESELKDPWKNEFSYRAPGEHGPFDLSSLGRDGKPGGEKWARDINSWD